jgi:hypothetical protein
MLGRDKGEIMGHRNKHTSRFKKTRARQRWKWHLKKMRRRSKYRRYVRQRAQ